MVSTPSVPSLPVILCFHGAGSNATVFKIQSRRIVSTLQNQFKFVFIDAPFVCEPGFGMVPVFESCAPFFRWNRVPYVPGLDHEMEPEADMELVQSVMDTAVEENGGWSNVVGFMGFSMGGRLGTGLLLKQLMEAKENPERAAQSDLKIKFTVNIGCPYPPITPEICGRIPTTEDYELLKTVPSVHAWGEEDHMITEAEQLADIYGGDMCEQMEFEGSHHLPLTDGESSELCNLIRKAWYSAGGKAIEHWRRQTLAMQ